MESLSVCLGVDQKCASKQDAKDFFKKVQEVLADPKGWKQFGYNFNVVCEPYESDIKIYLTCPDNMRKLSSNETTELNLCDMKNRIVYVHADRWLNRNTQFNKSGMSLEDYRTYVINHEVGHALGCKHLDTCLLDGRSPVMKQQPPGQTAANGKMCTPNPYPTEEDNKLTVKNRPLSGGCVDNRDCDCHVKTIRLR